MNEKKGMRKGKDGTYSGQIIKRDLYIISSSFWWRRDRKCDLQVGEEGEWWKRDVRGLFESSAGDGLYV